MTVGLGGSLRRSKYDDAVRTLCAAVDLDPPIQTISVPGQSKYGFTGENPEIRDRLQKIVQLYPGNGPAIYYYACACGAV